MKNLTTLACLGLAAPACMPPAAGNAQMWRHFDAAAAINEAVIDGDLMRARSGGQWLAERGGADPPIPNSDSLENEMRRYAQQVASAADISEAASGAASLARTCGECHRTFGPGPAFGGRGVPPPESDDVRREMQRHAWASTRLWEGLVGPSDAAWEAGARVFQNAPLEADRIPAREGDRIAIETMARHAHDLGRRAVGVTNTEDRAVLYADLIATCAVCHSIVER